MTFEDPTLSEFVRRGREERNLEYKGTSGADPFAWGPYPVNAKITRTAMGMANIGGGTIVLGMDQIGPDEWAPNGVLPDVDQTYQQDEVQQYVNQQADPYIRLALRHVDVDGRRFVIIQIDGFDELPVVCARGDGQHLRPGAVYTRSFAKHETVEIRTQAEMRELLDRAIEVGVQKRLRPFIATFRDVFGGVEPDDVDARRFEEQRGSL